MPDSLAIVAEQSEVQIALYDAMCAAIAAAYQVDEIQSIRDKARVYEAAAKIAGNTEAEDRCYQIRRRAERRLGQIMAEQKATVGLAPAGRPSEKIGLSENPISRPPSQSQAYAYTDPQSPEELSVARAAALTGPGAPAIAEYFASRAGGVFCALPQSTGGCPMTLTADAIRESGEAVAAALETLRSKPTAAARAKVRKELEESICAQAALLAHFREDDA